MASDLEDRREVTVTADRVFAAEGSDDERSWQYLSLCGLAGQWRQPKLLPLDDEVWADGLLAKQDQWARLGPDVAFEIDAPSENVRVTARYRRPQGGDRGAGTALGPAAYRPLAGGGGRAPEAPAVVPAAE